MKTFTQTITVTADDLDELEHVNNVRYVQWIQDISKAHWQAEAPPWAQEKIVWVVMSHHILYKGAAKLNDIVRITTHVAESKGATSVRVVEMFNHKTNTLLLRSTTEWCLLDAHTLRPTRITEDIKNIFITP